MHKEREYGLQHYSDKGGHLARSDFWREVKRCLPPEQSPTRGDLEFAWLMRRKMPRNPRSGRK